MDSSQAILSYADAVKQSMDSEHMSSDDTTHSIIQSKSWFVLVEDYEKDSLVSSIELHSVSTSFE